MWFSEDDKMLWSCLQSKAHIFLDLNIENIFTTSGKTIKMNCRFMLFIVFLLTFACSVFEEWNKITKFYFFEYFVVEKLSKQSIWEWD